MEGTEFINLSLLYESTNISLALILGIQRSGKYLHVFGMIPPSLTIVAYNRFDRRFRIYDISDFGETVRTYKRTENDDILDEMILVGSGAPAPYEGAR